MFPPHQWPLILVAVRVQLAEELLIFFVDIGQKECFAACLFTCYNLIKADMALELGWRHNIMDFTMPFLVQWVRQYADKVDGIIRERKAEKEQQKAEKEEQDVVEQSSAMRESFFLSPSIFRVLVRAWS